MSKLAATKLFLCFTPLHLWIALSMSNSAERNIYWVHSRELERFSSLFESANRLGGMKISSNALNFLIILCQVKEVEAIYCGNYKKLFGRMFFSRYRNASVYSFDDGVGNLDLAGYFYTELRGLKGKILKLLPFMPKYLFIKSRIVLHHTVFVSLLSKIDQVTLVELNPTLHSVSINGVIDNDSKVYLGSCFYEDGFIDLQDESAILNSVSETADLVYYLPHPREKIDQKAKILPSNFKVLRLNCPSEVFLFKNRARIKSVYGQFSTIFLLLENSGINLNCVYSQKTSFLLKQKLLKNTSVSILDIAQLKGSH